ncbi:MAG: zinc ABC transporter substrate-binding protein [Thermoplasmatales archaeon]|nr:MAG: zinc ABC transporter substrate-binding protein [Thermoplasmatales archaeon]
MKIKKITLIFTSLLFLFLSNNVSAEEDSIKILCSNAVLADFTSNLIKENVSINHIMPGGACPSHFDITPGDIEKCINADVVISLGYETWLEPLINNSGNIDVKQIKCTDLGEWSLPSNAVKFVEKIRDELIILYPEQLNTIKINAEEYIALINQTNQALKNMITKMGYKNRQVICIIWQKDFVENLGFEIIASYAPPESLSFQDQINIANTATNKNICAIIDNLQSGTEFGERISEKTDVSHVIFTNFPGAINNVDTYIDQITYNTAELVKGIIIFDYKKDIEIDSLQNQKSDIELQRNTSMIIAVIMLILTIVLLMMYKRK